MTASPHVAAPAATIGRRVGAFAIDLGVAYGIAAVLVGVAVPVVFGVGATGDSGSLAVAVVLAYLVVGGALLAWWLVYSAMQGGRGSIGQRALGLQLQDIDSRDRIGFWRAVWRNIVFGLAGSIVIGYFSPLFDSSGRRQGWHDMASRSMVLDIRADQATSQPDATGLLAENPYLAAVRPHAPQPLYGAPVPDFPAAAAPAPADAPPALAGPAPATRPIAPIRPGVIDGVPWVTGDALVTRAVHADEFPSMTMPFPAATTTEPLAALFGTGTPAAPAPVAAPARPFASVASIVAPPAAPARPLASVVAPASVAFPSSTDDLDETRMVVPPPAQRAALYDEAPVLAVLTWDDGTRMAVYGRTLYGRNPANEHGAVSIPVRDETLSLSKTHFEIGGDSTGAWIVDRHSTNGTTLVRDGARIPLMPGVRTNVRAGDTFEFGDRRVAVSAA
ncbi:RDD family protein [Microbacterium sp. QXD-8]|uniref:RDD family protein n=1 Tax=Microbacterium psychrotolerans TaxID=3068321 RepID=A0ABU0YYS0_9MICO|nr:RDD family protein [Microbacterium sp. QXD-8]MDQ7876704.1 RDD family protein [Microbacterium sp. QXD-8]